MQPQSTSVLEEWRPVVGYEGWYSVSSMGRVRRDMAARRTYAGRICKPALSRGGYPCVGLCKGAHATLQRHRVHVLVAEAFLGPRLDGHGINHKNGSKTDNRPCNLEWMTPVENSRHAARMGLLATGDRQGARLHPETRPRGDEHPARLHPEKLARGSHHGNAKLTEAAARDILASSLSLKALAEKYNVSVSLVCQVRQRTIWTHVLI